MTRDASVGKLALQRLEEMLASYSHLDLIRTERTICVRATEETGFDVELVDDGEVGTIFAGGWHGHFDDPEQAASTFMWLLPSKVRVVLTFRGKSQTAWKMQWDEKGRWVDGGQGGILLAFLCWGPKREIILQNNLLAGGP